VADMRKENRIHSSNLRTQPIVFIHPFQGSETSICKVLLFLENRTKTSAEMTYIRSYCREN